MEIESLFHELAQLREEVASLRSELEAVKNERDDMKSQLQNRTDSRFSSWERANNDLEQYSRVTSIRITGIEDTENEDGFATEKKVVRFLKDNLNINVESNDIDICHRLGKFNPARKRAVIVKLVRRKTKHAILHKRRALKGSGCGVSEDLTAANFRLMKAAKEVDGVQDSWSIDGKLFVKSSDNIVRRIVLGTPLTHEAFFGRQQDRSTPAVQPRPHSSPSQQATRGEVPYGPASSTPRSAGESQQGRVPNVPPTPSPNKAGEQPHRGIPNGPTTSTPKNVPNKNDHKTANNKERSQRGETPSQTNI